MGKYFGTDGFRGLAGEELTSIQAYKIGRFLGWYYGKNGKRVRAVIGKDTRRSSYMLEYAIATGLSSSGASAYMLHVTTTPSVSYATITGDFDFGIMISASHNPYYDNGIKIVNSRGEKLEDSVTEKIEAYLDERYDFLGLKGDIIEKTRQSLGEIIDYSQGRNQYIGYLISLSKRSFKGLRIGLDLSNGGGWMIGKSVFDALGAKTYTINDTPNGININDKAGSTNIEYLARFVKENNLDMGFAFDGDADRCIAVDGGGNVVNGDHILYILGSDLKRKNELSKNTIVTTVMSNLGLYKALREENIDCEITSVGDKNVYDCMQKNGYSIGGEQSGHIILSKYATTGDGILTAIKLTEAVVEGKTTLEKLRENVVMLPQVTRSILVESKERAEENERVQGTLEEIKALLGNDGRILFRKSGTEPVIRIMVEAKSYEECVAFIDRIEEVMKKEGLCRN